jgi:hypothetical protein
MALSDTTRRVQNVHFGQADLFAYDTTLTKYVSFGYAQDTTLEISWEETQLESGSPRVIIDTEITKLSVTLTTQILELSAANLQRLLPANLVKLTTGAILESYDEIVTLSGLVQTTLRFPNIQSTPDDIKVTSPDGLTVYVKESAPAADDNDYSIDYVTGELNRTTTSTIPTNTQVKVQYNYSDANATVINMGGKQCSASTQQFVKLRAIARSRKCAYRGIEIFKAVPQSPLSLPLGNAHSVVDAKFIGQDDETQPLGFNLFKLILGSDAQI